MAITQDVNIEMLEKLPDGNFKRKNPKTTKSQVGLGSVENYGIATKVEAQAGASNAKYMTPIRVKEAIEVLGSRISGGSFAGDSITDRLISVGFTPKAVLIMPTYSTALYVCFPGRVIAIGTSSTTTENTAVSIDGDGFVIHLSKKSLLNRDGSITHYIAVG